MKKNKPLTIGFVSTYPPRECGIATYTKNLISYIKKNKQMAAIKIVAISDHENYKYPQEVVFNIAQQNAKDYIKAAKFINQSDIDVVSLQHEFGIFGGFNGKKILYLLKYLKKPVVMTMHTVPIHQKSPHLIIPKRWKTRTSLLNKIFPLISGITVMNNFAKEYLEKKFAFCPNIKVIPHGAPEIALEALNNYKKEKTNLGFKKDDFIITTFGLISPKKGLEFVIEALPEIIRKNPNLSIKYLIAGRMHPDKPKKYLFRLKRLARKLKLVNNIIFDSRYLKYSEIYKYLANTNIYITPYYTKEQASSGTLSYAVAAGCCIVSTPYIFALDLLERKKVGELIGFKSSLSIIKVIDKLIKDRKLITKYQNNSYNYGKNIYWPKIADDFISFYKKVLEK